MGKIEDQMTDTLPDKTEKGNKANRASRNKSEKDRRDKVNVFINELAALVPGCSPQSKKLDKATILKNAVDYMKIHNDLTVAITRKSTNSCLNSDELGQLMLEGYHAFLFVISLSGSFKFLSESVYDLIGYLKDELIEKNVYDYIVPEDKLVLMTQLSQDNRPGTARNSAGSSSFYIRFKTNVDGQPFYETLRCCGNLRTLKEEVKSTENEDSALSSNESCFVVLAKLVRPSYLRNVNNWLSMDVEFTSRQSLDGKFLYLDPRCIPITGYLPYEILGSMIYEYIHFDDLESISTSFEALLEDGEGETGNYRILTKGCQWIMIKTSSYISYNHWNSKPEFVCSTHVLVRKPDTGGITQTDGGSGVQVDEISSMSGSDRSSFWSSDDYQSDASTDMSRKLLRNNQTRDVVTKKVTFQSSFQPTSARISPYSTAQSSLERINNGVSEISQTLSQRNVGTLPATPRSADESEPKPNSNQVWQQSSKALQDISPPAAVEKNRQSLSAVAVGYWSEQDTTISSQTKRFNNPLAPTSQPQQQSTERFTPSPNNACTTDNYRQSPRISRGYTELQSQTHHSEHPQKTWQATGHSAKSSVSLNEFTQQRSSQGYYPPSPLTSGRTFQPPRQQKLHNRSQSSSSFPSNPGDGNHPVTSSGAHVMSSQTKAQDPIPSLPSNISTGYRSAEYPAVTAARVAHYYPQSTTHSGPHSITTTAEYYSPPSSLSPPQSGNGMMQCYQQSSTTPSPQPRIMQGYHQITSSSSTQSVARLTHSYAQSTSSTSPQPRMLYRPPSSKQDGRMMQTYQQSAMSPTSSHSSSVIMSDYQQSAACLSPTSPKPRMIQNYRQSTLQHPTPSPEPGSRMMQSYHEAMSSPTSQPNTRMTQGYNQSNTTQKLSQPTTRIMTENFEQCSTTQNLSQSGANMVQGYHNPGTQYPGQSPQTPTTRYSSPYTSPLSPDSSNNPSRSRDTPLSPSVGTMYTNSAAGSHTVPSTNNYPGMSSYSAQSRNERHVLLGGGYAMSPQSPYDYPVTSSQRTNISPERYIQPGVSPHAISQNTVKHPRSPKSNPLTSPALPLRHSGFSEQVVPSRRPNPHVDNLNSFTMQPNQQQHAAGIYYPAQVKKSSEGSLQSCQVRSDLSRTSLRPSADMMERTIQTTEHYSTETRVEEVFSAPHATESTPQYSFNSSNRAPSYDDQTLNQLEQLSNNQPLEKRRDQTCQLTQEPTFNGKCQVATLSSVEQPETLKSAYAEAQRILQNQLLQKQNHLQNVIQNQKAQLSRIQEHIILNAQAQFSLHDVGDLESTKQLQTEVHDLEVQRKQQEAKHCELKALFFQRLQNGRSTNEDMCTGGVTSPSMYSSEASLQPLQHARNNSTGTSFANNNASNYPGLNCLPSQVSLSTHQKSRGENLSNSCEFSTNKLSAPGPRRTSSSQGFGDDELFTQTARGQTSGHYIPARVHSTPISTHYKTAADSAPSQPSDFDRLRQKSPAFGKNTQENSGSDQAKDYFSKFSASELETFLSTSSFPPTSKSSTPTENPSSENDEKEETAAPSTYDSLLLQQKRLLEMQEEQRRQLVRRQQEQLLILQQEQQQQQRMLVNLQRTPEGTEQNESQISSQGGVEDPNSLLSHELSDEDLSVLNMLLNEEFGAESWTEEIFDKNTSSAT